MEEPEKRIPSGCNFIGWFDIGRSVPEIARGFESAGWTSSMYEPSGEASDATTLPTMILEQGKSQLKLVQGDPNVLSGRLARPEAQVIEIRTVLHNLSLIFICRWRDAAAREWQDMPATPEFFASMGRDMGFLTDEDRAAMAASYVRQQVAAARRPWWRLW
jgi:hypothetical protein